MGVILRLKIQSFISCLTDFCFFNQLFQKLINRLIFRFFCASVEKSSPGPFFGSINLESSADVCFRSRKKISINGLAINSTSLVPWWQHCQYIGTTRALVTRKLGRKKSGHSRWLILRPFTDFTKIHFLQNWISFLSNAKVDDSTKCLAHLAIIISGNVHRVLFSGNLHLHHFKWKLISDNNTEVLNSIPQR